MNLSIMFFSLLADYEKMKKQERSKAEIRLNELQETLPTLIQKKKEAVEKVSTYNACVDILKENFDVASETKIQIEQTELQIKELQQFIAQSDKTTETQVAGSQEKV